MRLPLFPILLMPLLSPALPPAFPALPPAAFGSAEAAEIKHPAWTSEDSAAAADFIQGITRNPEAIDSLVSGALARDHELGFGHHMREVWVNPAGKLGFSLKIVYEGKRPISFEVKPVLNYSGLKGRYLQMLSPAFKVRPTGGPNLFFAPYAWNLAAAANPLPADSLGGAFDDSLSPDVREALSYYMTPYSGTLYGIRGGDAHQILENRDYFLSLTDMLMADKRLSRHLLRSLNPASRLTAAEFIIRHKDDFPDYDALLRTALHAVFANPRMAATLRGGAEAAEDARKLAFEYSRLEAVRDGRGVLRMY
jgi:hypothetical protein